MRQLQGGVGQKLLFSLFFYLYHPSPLYIFDCCSVSQQSQSETAGGVLTQPALKLSKSASKIRTKLEILKWNSHTVLTLPYPMLPQRGIALCVIANPFETKQDNSISKTRFCIVANKTSCQSCSHSKKSIHHLINKSIHGLQTICVWATHASIYDLEVTRILAGACSTNYWGNEEVAF